MLILQIGRRITCGFSFVYITAFILQGNGKDVLGLHHCINSTSTKLTVARFTPNVNPARNYNNTQQATNWNQHKQLHVAAQLRIAHNQLQKSLHERC